jgi:hypothetical protein
VRSFIICIPRQLLLGWSNNGELDETDMQHAWGKLENHKKILVGKSEGRRLVGRPRHRWEESAKRQGEMVLTGITS